MDQKLLRDLGKDFYEWRKKDKVKFIYGTKGKGLDEKIERISGLIEYVKSRRKSGSKNR
jgi:hypothetical protein